MTDATTGSPEEILRNRFASGEIDTAEYEKSLRVPKGERSIADGRAARGGGGAVYAQGQGNSMMGADNAPPEANDGGGMGGMMNGGESMSGGTMGSFDEEQPFDLQFIDQMTMHHEGAIMSSEHMISDSERPELRQLAESIRQSQSEQIKQMQQFRKRWFPDREQTSGMPAGMMDEMMGDGGMMDEMMGGSMQEMMGGDATDEMFLRMMIPHHQMAVDMAEKALEEAEHPELEELARTIRDEQSAEIELMRGYLEEIEASTEGEEGPTTEADESQHEH
ncbi:MAG: DUF305 domain-containing protein [Actinomycetota bacterium]|nr:DUF305 domain-containing protein [Actinomycetota bacterium]